MNYRSFQVSSKIIVVLFVDNFKEYDVKVRIIAYWVNNDNKISSRTEILDFVFLTSALSFIEDFTYEKALKWFENFIPEEDE